MKNRLTLTLVPLLALTACDGVRESMGLERTPPNEFAVSPSQVPLEMPPDFYKLPTPKPGVSRPQEEDHAHRTIEILTGKSRSTSAKSTGQTALLNEAGVQGISEDVRSIIDKEAAAEARRKGTIVEQLKLMPKKIGTPLKAKEEQKRLHEEGIPTSGYSEIDAVDESAV